MNAFSKKTSKVVCNVVKLPALFVFLCNTDPVSALSYEQSSNIVMKSGSIVNMIFNENTLILLLVALGVVVGLLRVFARKKYKEKKESLDNIGVEKIERRDSVQKVEFAKLEKRYEELRESRNLMGTANTSEDDLSKTVVLSKIVLDVDPAKLEQLAKMKEQQEESFDETGATVTDGDVKSDENVNEVAETVTEEPKEVEQTNNENNEQNVDETKEENVDDTDLLEEETEEEAEEEIDNPNVKKIGKKIKNVLEKTLELKRREIHELASTILEGIAAKEEYKTVLNTFVSDYVVTKYIKQCDFESKNAKTLKKLVNVELENTANRLINNINRSYTNDFVWLIYNVFLIINKIDCMDTNIERAIYENNTLNFLNKDELIKRLKKVYKSYHTIFYDYLKKLEIDKFKLIYTRLDVEGFNPGDMLMTNISSSIQFSKIFSDFIINKTYANDVILEDIREVQLKLISFNILEDMLHFNYKKKYIINLPASLFSKEKKISSLLSAVNDTYSQNKLFILIDMETLKNSHELILKLKREGFKFMIQVNGESIKLYDDAKKHLSLVEYVIYVGPRLSKSTLREFIPSYLMKRIIYSDKNLTEGVVIK